MNIKKKINIGIIINDINNLKDYQLNLIWRLKKKKYINFKIFHLNDEKIRKSDLNYFKIENKYLIQKKNKEIINYVKSLKFSKIKLSDFETYNKNHVNIFLNFSGEIIINNIKKTNIPIWDIVYGKDNEQSSPKCFFDILYKRKASQIKIIELSPKKIFYKINEGFFNIRTYSILNQEFLFEKSVVIFLKSLKYLYQKRLKKNKYTLKIDCKDINLIYCVKYFFYQYFLKFFLDHYPKKNWKIYFFQSKKNNLNIKKTYSLLPKNENSYFADPFIYIKDNIKYIFFENFSNLKKRGHLSVAEIKQQNMIKIKDILVKKYHISYPFVYYKNKKYFLIPETSQKKELQIFQSIKFPYKWKLYKRFFVNESVADPTLFKDKKNNLWLFLNKSIDKYNNHDSELYIYKVEGIFSKLIPHNNNPVIINSEFARNAGNLFYYKNNIIKPCQINTYGKYGNGINFIKIERLDLNNFQFKVVKKIQKIHHFSVDKNFFAFDQFE